MHRGSLHGMEGALRFSCLCRIFPKIHNLCERKEAWCCFYIQSTPSVHKLLQVIGFAAEHNYFLADSIKHEQNCLETLNWISVRQKIKKKLFWQQGASAVSWLAIGGRLEMLAHRLWLAPYGIRAPWRPLTWLLRDDELARAAGTSHKTKYFTECQQEK